MGFTRQAARTTPLDFTVQLARTAAVDFIPWLARTPYLDFTCMLARTRLMDFTRALAHQPFHQLINLVVQHSGGGLHITAGGYNLLEPLEYVAGQNVGDEIYCAF